MGKKSITGSGMNIPDYFSESVESIFGLKILKFFYADHFDPGSGMEKFGSGINKFGSGINIPDPQHGLWSVFKSWYLSLSFFFSPRVVSHLFLKAWWQ
jgi:hypothetical protein